MSFLSRGAGLPALLAALLAAAFPAYSQTAVRVTASVARLDFESIAGETAPAQSFGVTRSGSGVAFNSSTVVERGSGWLRVEPSSGSFPAEIRVTADGSGLDPGSYNGWVVVVALPDGAPEVLSIPLTLRVRAKPPRLAVETAEMTLTAQAGAGAAQAVLRLENRGSGAGVYEIAAQALSGDAWLSVDPQVVEIAPGGTADVTVTADPTRLPPGTQTARISVVGADSAERIDIAVLFVVNGNTPTPQIISTLAGTAWNFASEGRQGTVAPLGPVFGVATGPGGIYIADAGNHMVFRLDSDGVLHRVAGNGEAGGDGDGGRATEARLRYPFRLTFDKAGNLYITDRDDHRVRRVSPDGIISTAAGTGQAGYSGDGSPATEAALYWPRGVAVDSAGNLFIADTGNARIRKVAPDGSITTIAGTGEVGAAANGASALQSRMAVEDVAVDAAGQLLFTNRYNGTIASVEADGTIRIVAGAGTPGFSGDGAGAASARFSQYLSLATGPAGELYIADSGNSRVRKVEPSGVVSTVAGSGVAAFSGDGGAARKAALRYPYSVAVDGAGVLWIADTHNFRVRRVGPDGSISTVAGNGAFRNAPEGGPAIAGILTRPRGVAVDGAGNVYIADTEGNRIRKVQPDGTMTTVGGTGTYGYFNDGGPATEAAIVLPRSVAVDTDGNVFYSDGNSNSVRKIDRNGTITRVAGMYDGAGFSGDGGRGTEARLAAPEGVALDAAGNLYVADAGNNRVRRIAPDGTISTMAGNGKAESTGDGGAAVEAGLNVPAGVAVDAAGNLYIAEFRGQRVRRVSPDGVIITYAGDGSRGFAGDGGPSASASFKDPYGLAVDAAGNLYIADANAGRIRKVSPERVITTVAGAGGYGFSGDGDAATDAVLAFPTGVAVDGSGRLFIADRDNDRIRVVAP